MMPMRTDQVTAGGAPVDLTAAEQAALAIATAPQPPTGPLRAARRVLGRFLVPLAEASAALGLDPSARVEVQRYVLLGMQARGTAWGTWDAATWSTVAGTAGHVRANVLGVAAWLGLVTGEELLAAGLQLTPLARRLFGRATLDQQIGRVEAYLRGVGYGPSLGGRVSLAHAVAALFIRVGRAELEALTVEAIEAAHRAAPMHSELRTSCYRLAHALHGMGLLPRAISRRVYPTHALTDVDPEWARWCGRWLATTTLAPPSAQHVYYDVLKAGRWLAHEHPEVREPDGWSRELALSYVAALNSASVGDLVAPNVHLAYRHGVPLAPRTKARLLGALRRFFWDCQEWGWCARRFDPARALATPRSVRALIGPQPRVLADDVWAKLLWAGLHLDETDLPSFLGGAHRPDLVRRHYPLPLVRALARVWLFAGLRSDELRRLRLGSIRWQRHDGGPGAAAGPVTGDGATCLLDVPTHKTGTSYTKPVDPLVGEAIATWEAQRPRQPLLVDRKTGERVAFLFCLRGRLIPTRYFNHTLIPLLCRKAGLPLEDARGRITSHRARATIASQLYNAKEPMTLFELQAWLGHQSPQSTQYYAQITPTTLAKAYSDAGYFARNVRTIAVLVDREAVASGDAAAGKPWQYFDLAHGYCTYAFFEQCPHRLACARCDFYVPKGSTQAQLLEAKDHLQRMLAEIPLTDDERAAVEDGTLAVQRLLERLADIPTPAGPTPRELAPTNFIPLTSLTSNTKDLTA